MLHGAATPGRIDRREPVVICFLGLTCGSACFLAISDQTDVGVSSALPLALAFSVIPMLCPLTRLAVRSAVDRRGWQLFHVLQPSQDDLGSLYTPAVLCSRRMVQQLPSQTAYLLVQASQPLWLANIHDACERSFRFNLVTRL